MTFMIWFAVICVIGCVYLQNGPAISMSFCWLLTEIQRENLVQKLAHCIGG